MDNLSFLNRDGWNMMKIIERTRRSAILRHPLLPCLARHYTINLTSGCPNQCVYCYAKSYTFHPGWGTVVYYSNSFEALQRELARKRRQPELVYFSTASEPFLPAPSILDGVYNIMRLLLEQGIFILISTKCAIPERFIQLFKQFHVQVHIQVGMTTANDDVRQTLEPNAASVQERLNNLVRLIGYGIKAELRMDPLIPGLTDMNESFDRLLDAVEQTGVRSGMMSYLFLRPSIRFPEDLSFGSWSFREAAQPLYTTRVDDYCGDGIIWIPRADYRKESYARLKEIARSHRIVLNLCRCKNKDVTDEFCHPTLPQKVMMNEQTELF